MAGKTSRFYPGKRQVLVLALVVAAVYVLLPQLGNFRSSWRLLGHADAGATAAAILLSAGTFVAAAGTYCLLSFRPLSYTRTLIIQLAATFVNRLLPAGIGALGANYLYLRHERHSASQAGSIVAINNLLGLAGHSLLVGTAILFFSDRAHTSQSWHGPRPALILAATLAAAGIMGLMVLIFGQRKVVSGLKDLRKQLLHYRGRPLSLLAALGTSITLTLCNTLCLFFCAQALGLHLSFVVILLVFTLGLGAGSAVPTPGGLGGFEAGLAAGFVGYGIAAAPALAAALLYRLVSYWLPLVAGAGAFAFCQRQKLFDA